MGYSSVPMYFLNGNFYYIPPGELVYCTKDDNGLFRYGDFIFTPEIINPSNNGQLFRSHAIRYIPFELPNPVNKIDTLFKRSKQ